jgi:hypothetical protein
MTGQSQSQTVESSFSHPGSPKNAHEPNSVFGNSNNNSVYVTIDK